jgi:IS605 OrfB family transposase
VGGKSHTLYGWNKVSRAIVLGKLKGVRRKDKGRRFYKKLNRLPYNKLSRFIGRSGLE